MNDTETPTLLKALVRQQHLKYETFCRRYEKIAGQVAPDEVPPSKAQYYRWLSGQLKESAPYPNACRVLEAMFPPWTVGDLLGAYEPSQHPLTSADPPATGASLLGTIPNIIPADVLQDAWVTSFHFTHGQEMQCHADITHITPQADCLVSAANYPPTPRSEGRSAPFRNTIEARLVNRHLVGNWKNVNDARYFGSLHLAVLPGETVIEGQYTGFASDVEVSTGRWKWVRIDPESLAGVSLPEVSLCDPVAIYKTVRDHASTDGPITLTSIREDT